MYGSVSFRDTFFWVNPGFSHTVFNTVNAFLFGLLSLPSLITNEGTSREFTVCAFLKRSL